MPSFLTAINRLVPPDADVTPVTEIFTPFAKHLVAFDVPPVRVNCPVHAPLGAHAAMTAFACARQGSAAHDARGWCLDHRTR